jgi:hypothetical protein
VDQEHKPLRADLQFEREIDSEALLNQFNRLVQELLRGSMARNTFRPWEIELLLDIESCQLKDGQKRETMRRYQKAVQRQMEKGAPKPMKLSEYLEANRLRRETGGESL